MQPEVIGGKYRIIKKLGEGGYGTVYLVEHVDLGARFALKLLNQPLAQNDRSVERFKREAEILLRFSHPGSVLLRDFSRDERGAYYMVTDFCDGVSLEELLGTKQKFSVAQVLVIIMQVLETLEAAHQQQIVHRDIKASNVMLRRWNSSQDNAALVVSELTLDKIVVLLLDFGVAKLQEDLQGGRQSMTTEGVSIGTPVYMSPEQASGQSDLDHRVDLYAIGVLMYELLSGEVPFMGKTVVQTLLKHLTQPPPPFDEKLEIPHYISSIVLKALEKEREKRYATAEEFRIACEQALKLVAGEIARKINPSRKTIIEALNITENEQGLSDFDEEPSTQKKVLCLDDNEMILQIMKHLLEKEGYKVFTANNFSVIHDIVFKEKVDLMLCDVQMPGLPGNKICQMLKKVIPSLKIVLFSNIPERELEKLSIESKADAWLSKNAAPPEWITRIREFTSAN